MRRVIGILQRCSPKGHDGITDIFVYGSFLSKNATVERMEYAIERLDEFGRLQCLGETGKTFNVAKQYGYLLLLRTNLVSLVNQRGNDCTIDMLGENISDFFLLIKSTDCGIRVQNGEGENYGKNSGHHRNIPATAEQKV